MAWEDYLRQGKYEIHQIKKEIIRKYAGQGVSLLNIAGVANEMRHSKPTK